jgi:enamine deaminase RidA (YjgF/YER057c/UK114 family)
MELLADRRRFLERAALVAAGLAAGVVLSNGPESKTLAQEKPVHSAEEQLKALKIELPVIPKTPTSLILPCVRAGDLLFTSGQVPIGPDGKMIVGKLGADMDVKQGAEAARNVALRILSVVRTELGSLDKVVRVVKALGMVNCTPDFTQSPAVINGFSELLIQVFGEAAGKAARSAVGMVALPGGVPVEVELILQVK